ncbi:MAG TPA: creatininase family protein, partial [Deferrisomatales bacterium]|nr:creatininase family protein [Deferrisomatales bacterium]
MLLSDLTMPGFEEALDRTRVAILPVGSVEEHGRHLPLATDTWQVCESARRAAALAPAIVCPPLHYGYCRSTRDHPGTVSISPGSLRAVVVDIGAGLHRQGIRGLIIASGHAGGIHMAALEEAGERLVERCEPLEVAVVCEYRLAQEAGATGLVKTADDGHAGEIETSRIQALRPELVRGTSPAEYPTLPRPFIARDKRADWPGGVWGDPGPATAATGEALFEAAAGRLAELVREMQRRIAAGR